MSTPGGRIFSSWKEIATYLGKGVRTVQRWEKTVGLPVRRPIGSASSVIVATENELRRWIDEGEKTVTRQYDPKEIRKLQEQIEKLEEMQKRLEEAIAGVEEKFAKIVAAMDSNPERSKEFNDGDRHPRSKGNGSKERYGTSGTNKPHGRGDGGSSSGRL